MRKLFSLIAAVLFAGSMMATTVTKTVEELATANSWENGVVVTPFALDEVISVSTEATDANTGKYYTSGQQIRLYQTGAAKMIISAAEGYTISSITVTYASEKGGIFAEAASGVAVDFEEAVESATFTVGNSGEATNGQARVTSISVTYDGGEVPPTPADTYTVAGAPEAIFGSYWDPADTNNDMKKVGDVYTWEKAELELTAETKIEFKVVKNHSWDNAAYPASNYEITIAEDGEYTLTITFDATTEAVAAEAVKKEPLADPTTCAEAAAAALSVSANNELYNDGKEYTIEGYVTSIAYAWESGSMSFWMADAADGGNVLEAYKCAIADEADAVRVGDKVQVTGSLTKYNTTPEFAQGCTVTIIERAEVVEPENLGEKTIAEFLELKNQRDTCILTGIVANVKNTKYGNFDLVELDNAEVKVYVYGLLNAAGEAQKCFEEENIAEGDTLKVLAIYSEYNNAPQVKNAIFVEVKKVPVEAETIEITMTSENDNITWEDYCSSYGWWQIHAENDAYIINLSNYYNIAEASGTFTVADLDPTYSYIKVLPATDKIKFTEGEITVAASEEAVVVAGTLVAANGNTYVLSLTCAIEPANLYEYDDDSDFIREFAEYEVNDQYLAQYGDVYVMAQDEENYTIVLDIYAGSKGLVPAVLEINNTYAAPSVASGMFLEGGVYPSYAAIASASGLTNVWYLVSGTVTIDENLNIEVDAVNSLGHAIKVTLKAKQETAIENTEVESSAVKSVKDNMLLIEKNGKVYNAVGQLVK